MVVGIKVRALVPSTAGGLCSWGREQAREGSQFKGICYWKELSHVIFSYPSPDTHMTF